MYRGKGGHVFTDVTFLVRLSKNILQEDANPFHSSTSTLDPNFCSKFSKLSADEGKALRSFRCIR